ncbi:hypothetical protein PFICI_10778 [Pestalotiopsis fici W106-1]|uniref:Amino acid permease/ SLC12A domain-containing protein n=1 Tax=Pestalotiopsis fici (strain W106-1 / CGMCC3.15140) TaxID=1229662 RepID=W3WSW1_PESFW|nr:uncharacterized protein PFICI_10778 [Pestalotiopsis fici W106-1]ETS76904.1 hypothetical protein PFICI_10778 [Pestalotiopsis fici W106-1]
MSSLKKVPDPNELAPTSSCSPGQVEAGVISNNVRTSTHRGITARHSQMIALGGTIGTGLFVGSGQALARVGPGFLLFAYCVLGFLIYSMITATTTVSAYLPLPGSSMASYAGRYASKSLGFAMACLYWYSFAIIVAYEITAAALVIDYWPNGVHTGVWVTILLVVVVGLNLSPVAVYAETEFWFASTKVIMLLALLILSVVLCLGGGPNHERLGFGYWQEPGAWNSYLVDGAAGRVCAFVYALVYSSFSFGFGPELIVLTGGEMKSPRRNLIKAANTFILRLCIFYILGALAIGVICPSNASGLTSGSSDAAASPWVIGIKQAGIKGLDHVVNAGIVISAWSSANAYLYMSSRTLYSASVNGGAPKIFSRCMKNGLPIYAVLLCSSFALLAYLNVGTSTGVVFNWLINLTNSAIFISWICISFVFLRFTRACEVQGVKDLPYTSVLQPYAAYANIAIFSVLLLLNGFTVFFPGQWDTSIFLTSYLGIPIFLVLFAVHRFMHHQEHTIIPSEQVDLRTGMNEIIAVEDDSASSGLKQPLKMKLRAAHQRLLSRTHVGA